jgi:predicted phage terminase large subunit-like protein
MILAGNTNINDRRKLEAAAAYPEFQKLLKPKWNKYIPHEPTVKQQAALWLNCRELFYGGALGGGKSDWILMGGLQYVDCPGYSGLIIRDSFANLSKAEGLLTRAHEWLAPWIELGEVKWEDKNHTFHFLKYGTRLEFGYLDAPRDHLNYRSAAYQYIGIDELVGIREHQALFLFTRMRRLKATKGLPIRFRAASNPPLFDELERGEWVKNRYVNPKTRRKDIVFIPAFMGDNPYLDAEEYHEILAMGLDPISLRQLEDGDWEIQAADGFFEVHKIKFVEPEEVPYGLIYQIIRRWDMAATEATAKQKGTLNEGPAFTAGVKGCMYDGYFYVLDVVRDRLLPGDADELIVNTAKMDGPEVSIRVEQEPGSSGKRDMYHIGGLLTGYDFLGIASTGSKIVRARPFASMVSRGMVKFVRAPWNIDAINELRVFPAGKIKDIVDGASSCYSDLTIGGATTGSSQDTTAVESEVSKQQDEMGSLIFD